MKRRREGGPGQLLQMIVRSLGERGAPAGPNLRPILGDGGRED